MTRTREVWRPDKLVCKRFNVPDPFFGQIAEVIISQLLHNSVNLSFTITYIQNKLTNFGGNWLWKNDSKQDEADAGGVAARQAGVQTLQPHFPPL